MKNTRCRDPKVPHVYLSAYTPCNSNCVCVYARDIDGGTSRRREATSFQSPPRLTLHRGEARFLARLMSVGTSAPREALRTPRERVMQCGVSVESLPAGRVGRRIVCDLLYLRRSERVGSADAREVDFRDAQGAVLFFFPFLFLF